MQASDRIGRRLKLHDLHVLMTVVQAGSMARAAQRLNTGQPNVSRSIASLEHALGVRLLERSRGGISPTEHGRALLTCGTVVFDELRQGVKTIESLSDPTAGELRIGCSAILGATFVSAVIARLTRRYPRIVIHLRTAPIVATHDELLERSLDLMVARRLGPISDSRMDFEPLFDDRFVVATGKQGPRARSRSVKLADLVDEPWTLPPPASPNGSIATEAFRASGLNYPRTTVFIAPTEVRISLLATGRFFTILSDAALRFPKRRTDTRVLPIELPVAPVPVGVVTLKDRTPNPVARLFVDCAREVARALSRSR